MGAFFEEHGPFRTVGKGLAPLPALVLESVELQANPNSWSKVANVLYVDMPAGTGLSYSLDKADYVTNDTQAAQDSYQALRGWFELYPEFKNRNFYLSGESYAGIYIPLLASLIVTGNAQALHSINLQGYLLGNPTTNSDQYYRLAELYEGFSLISQELREKLETAKCPLSFQEHYSQSDKCRELQQAVEERIKPTFFFDILVDCFYGMQTFNKILFEEVKAKLAAKGIAYTDPLYGGSTDHCDYDDRDTGFLLNDDDFREAFHAAPIADSGGPLAGFFEMCQARLNYTRVTETTVPLHKANIKAGLSVFIYSGDHDRVVPTPGTEKWTRELGDELGGRTADFAPWWIEAPESFGPQVGGYLSLWKGLSFATIRGAGHQVPTHKPAHMLLLLQHYLDEDLAALTTRPPESERLLGIIS